MKIKMTSNLIFLALSFMSPLAEAVESAVMPDLKTVTQVELKKYLGKWYEIARLPNRFQKDCSEATAEYKLRADGNIDVINKCIRQENGSINEVQGLAQVVDTNTNAKLSVSFLPAWLRWTGIGKGAYWIIDLDENYEFAVVGEPSRKFLWILSRKSELNKKVFEEIIGRLKEQKYNTSGLIFSGSFSTKD